MTEQTHSSDAISFSTSRVIPRVVNLATALCLIACGAAYAAPRLQPYRETIFTLAGSVLICLVFSCAIGKKKRAAASPPPASFSMTEPPAEVIDLKQSRDGVWR